MIFREIFISKRPWDKLDKLSVEILCCVPKNTKALLLGN